MSRAGVPQSVAAVMATCMLLGACSTIPQAATVSFVPTEEDPHALSVPNKPVEQQDRLEKMRAGGSYGEMSGAYMAVLDWCLSHSEEGFVRHDLREYQGLLDRHEWDYPVNPDSKFMRYSTCAKECGHKNIFLANNASVERLSDDDWDLLRAATHGRTVTLYPQVIDMCRRTYEDVTGDGIEIIVHSASDSDGEESVMSSRTDERRIRCLDALVTLIEEEMGQDVKILSVRRD